MNVMLDEGGILTAVQAHQDVLRRGLVGQAPRRRARESPPRRCGAARCALVRRLGEQSAETAPPELTAGVVPGLARGLQDLAPNLSRQRRPTTSLTGKPRRLKTPGLGLWAITRPTRRERARRMRPTEQLARRIFVRALPRRQPDHARHMAAHRRWWRRRRRWWRRWRWRRRRRWWRRWRRRRWRRRWRRRRWRRRWWRRRWRRWIQVHAADRVGVPHAVPHVPVRARSDPEGVRTGVEALPHLPRRPRSRRRCSRRSR